MIGSSRTEKRFSFRGAGLLLFALIGVFTIVALTSTRNSTPPRGKTGFGYPLAVATVLPSVEPTSNAGSTPEPSPVVLRERDMGLWHYRVVRAGTDVAATIEYDRSSISSLHAYAAANVALASRLAETGGTIDMSVTFRSYVSPERFRSWIAEKGMTVKVAGLRILTTSGQRAGVAVMPEAGEALPESALHRPDNATVQGVMSVRGTIPANRLQSVALDPLVFIPDVTVTVVRRDVADIVADPNRIYMSSGSPFWEMEDFGLQNFR